MNVMTKSKVACPMIIRSHSFELLIYKPIDATLSDIRNKDNN